MHLFPDILKADTCVYYNQPYRAKVASLYDSKSFCSSTTYHTAWYNFCQYALYSQIDKEGSNIYTHTHTHTHAHAHTLDV